MNVRRALVQIIGMAGLLASLHAAGADFPTKPVRLISAGGAGSAGDVLARLLAEQLGSLWKQQVVVENRTGAGGVIAAQALLAASPDGYTLLAAGGSSLVITPFTRPDMPYDVDKDFAYVALIAESPLLIAASSTLPVKSIPELIAWSNANPGKINYSANTPGTFPHLATELFAQTGNAKMTFIPYKGASDALQDLRGGRINVMVEGISALVSGLRSGALRPLGVTSAKRLSTLPEVATVAESLPGFSAVGFFLLLAHPKIPEALAKKVNEDMGQVLAKPELAERLAGMGSYVRSMTPAELVAFVQKERATWGPVIKRMGFSPR